MGIIPGEQSIPKDNDIILRVIHQTRWVSIALVCLTYPFTVTNRVLAVGLILIAVVVNSLGAVPRVRQWLSRVDPLDVIVIDYVWIVALLALSGGISSPYYFYVVLPAVTTACWYGGRRLVFVSGVGVVATVLAAWYPPAEAPFHTWQRAVVYGVTAIWVGFLVERLTVSQRSERDVAMLATQRADIERTRLLSLVNSMTDAVLATDHAGVIVHYNAAALDLLNTNVALTGHKVREFLRLHDADGHAVQVLKQARAQRRPIVRDDLQFTNNNDEKVNVSVTISPIVSTFGGAKGKEGGFIMVLRDITKQKSLEEQRNEFISVASHELRTPLAIAEANISTALVIAPDKMAPDAFKLVKKAHESVLFLGNLVTDLTTLAAAEKDVLEVEVGIIDPGKLLRQLAQDYEGQAKEKGLEIKLAIHKDAPSVVSSEQRVREVLQNFITNSIKYTQKGSLTLHAERAEGDGLLLSVSDTGIGISASDQKRVFAKFYRSEDYRTRVTGGTGLGLYITTKIAERLNGKVWLTSKLNHGSTFYLQIPPASKLKRDAGRVIRAQVDKIIESI